MSEDTTGAISSQGSQDGNSPCNSQGGPQTNLFGQPLVPVPRSPSPEKNYVARTAKGRLLSGALDELASQYAVTASTLGLPMPGTYGRKFGASQANADLDESWGNKLRKVLPWTGTPECVHHLKSSITVLGRRMYRLQASEHPTAEIESGGMQIDWWRSPAAAPRGGAKPEKTIWKVENGGRVTLQDQVGIAGWVTPLGSDYKDGATTLENTPVNGQLGRQVLIAGSEFLMFVMPIAKWGTPKSQLAGPNLARGSKSRLEEQVHLPLAKWPTPMERDGSRGNKPPREHDTGVPLSQMVVLTNWPTPAARSGRQGGMYTDPEKALKRLNETDRQKDLENVVVIAGWTTPQSQEPTSKERPSREAAGRKTDYLGRQVRGVCPWATPTTNHNYRSEKAREGRSALTPSEAMSCSSSPAETEIYGALNPGFSGWLMGFPIEWDVFADSETP